VYSKKTGHPPVFFGIYKMGSLLMYSVAKKDWTSSSPFWYYEDAVTFTGFGDHLVVREL